MLGRFGTPGLDLQLTILTPHPVSFQFCSGYPHISSVTDISSVSLNHLSLPLPITELVTYGLFSRNGEELGDIGASFLG